GEVVIAAESAMFTMAYTRAGLTPDGGSTYLLPRLVGLRRAQDLLLTNRTLSAAEALDWGLVTSVVPDADLDTVAAETAERLAAGSKGAQSYVKSMLATAYSNGPEAQLEIEARNIAACAQSDDGAEGRNAFIAKRSPMFG